MMKEVRHGIAIGLVCVFIVAGIGSAIAQAMMGEHAEGAHAEEAAPAQKAEKTDKAEPTEKAEKTDKAEPAEKAEKTDKAEPAEKAEKTDKPAETN